MSSNGELPGLDFTVFHNTVNGSPRVSEHYYHGVNPTNRQPLWDVPVATRADVDEAVEAANAAFVKWSKTPIEQRREIVSCFHDRFLKYEKQFDDLISKECGKPAGHSEARGASRMLIQPTRIPILEEREEDDQRIMVTKYTPLGVVAAICPWNVPLGLAMGKIGPAMVTGNCIIVKPSPFTPYSILKAVEIAQEFFPPGVVQVLGGDDRLGPWLTEHPGIQKISFTGSTETGKKILATAAKTLKRVTLELGGNDPSIICPDVDIKGVAAKVAWGAFRNSGQVCVATKRIYVHESIYKGFLHALAEATRALKVGSSEEEGVKLGPVQNEMQYERVKAFFDNSAQAGHKFLTGGAPKQSKGFFIEPTLVDNPPDDSMIVTEEPFGPIVPVLSWTDEDEVIRRANNTNAGLGACVWSRDVDRAMRIANQIEAGSIFINSWEQLTPKAFFSGHKESGIGGEWGRQGLLSYCNTHVVHIFK